MDTQDPDPGLTRTHGDVVLHGHVVILILVMLKEFAPITRPEMKKHLKEKTGVDWQLNMPLYRLKEKGFITGHWVKKQVGKDTARNKVYRLTPEGEFIIEEFLQDLKMTRRNSRWTRSTRL